MRTLAAVLLDPGTLGPLTLRNRVIKAATFEGMTPGGHPSDALVDFHVNLARGGVGMTTVAYGAIEEAGRSFGHQLLVDDERIAGLRRLTDAVHREGAAASIQLTHCGFFTRVKRDRPPASASRTVNQYGLLSGVPFGRKMSRGEIADAVQRFVNAARRAREAGFDAVELHLGHGYLLSQFLSPATNRRNDQFGGDVRARAEFPRRVVQQVVDAVGSDLAVLTKTNLEDGFAGGLQVDDAVTIAKIVESAGVHGIIPSGGFTSRSPFYLMRGKRPLKRMIEVEEDWRYRASLRVFGPKLIETLPFEEGFLLNMADRVRAAVSVPVIALGGLVSRAGLESTLKRGYDFVQLGRALIADPDLVTRVRDGSFVRTRCNACNECVAEMDDGGVRCVLDGPR